jgi:hypothetical protein
VLHWLPWFALLGVLCACACGESHAPRPAVVAACEDSTCADAGQFTDGGIRAPVGPPPAADGGGRDAALSPNIIDQPDAAAPRVDAGVPACLSGACSGYRARGGFVSSGPASSGALRVSEQRVSGMPSSCGDVHGTTLCVRGGVWP